MIKMIKTFVNNPGFRPWDATSCHFTYRDKESSFIYYQNNDDQTKNRRTCNLDKKSAQELIKWLQECIDDPRCDKCWDYQFPSSFKGQVKCNNCGHVFNNFEVIE